MEKIMKFIPSLITLAHLLTFPFWLCPDSPEDRIMITAICLCAAVIVLIFYILSLYRLIQNDIKENQGLNDQKLNETRADLDKLNTRLRRLEEDLRTIKSSLNDENFISLKNENSRLKDDLYDLSERHEILLEGINEINSMMSSAMSSMGKN